jgi:multisite-specific tRNA:(cytosine-C5)-methyltransferase
VLHLGQKWVELTSFSAKSNLLSQTAQILEALHSQDTLTSSSIPSGLLVANDSDNKRTHLLIHPSARLPNPALMVTNLDASNYPVIKVPASLNTKDHTSVQEPPQSDKLEPLMFDRILCDVMCSGDGTMRKNIGIWKSWQLMDGNGLHRCVPPVLSSVLFSHLT